MACVKAPSPDPLNSGEMPQTIGPVSAAGPVIASAEKNERNTSAALRRDQRSSVADPASFLRSASFVSPTTDGGSIAASKIILMAGVAASTYRR